jgi:outer membrane protein TolC
VDTLRAGRTRVALAEANLRFAEETLNAERALQATGRTVQQNVLTAIKNVDDAKVALQQARSDHLVAIIELERLKGSL